MPNINMPGIASLIAQQGRNGDTMLMHVAPEEVEYLDSIGGITRNPVTDLPEAFKLKDLLPFVGSAVLGPAFKAVGFSPGVSNFLASTASTMLGGGSLERGIMSGLVSSSIGRLGQNLAETAPGAKAAPADTGYKFGIFKKPETGTFGSRYTEAFSSPQFNPVEQARLATEGGLENFLEQIQKPGVMIPFSIGAGELGRLNAEEQYARDFANFQEAQKRRRAELQRKYPQVLPGPRQFYPPPPTGFRTGGMTSSSQFPEENTDEDFFFVPKNESIPVELPVEDVFYTPRDESIQITPIVPPAPPAASGIAALPTPAAAQYDEKGNLLPAAGSTLGNIDWFKRMQLFGAYPSGVFSLIPDLVTTGTGGKDIGVGDLYKTKKEQAVKDYEDRIEKIRAAGELTPAIEEALKTNLNYSLDLLAKEESVYLNSLPQRQELSDLLKANKFSEAYKFAQDNNMQMLLLNSFELKNLRDPFTKDEAQLFIRSMPYDFIKSAYGDRYKFEEGFKFDPEGAESRGALNWVSGVSPDGKPIFSETGYPLLERVLLLQEIKNKPGIFEKIFKVAAIATAVFGGAQLLGITGGGAAAPGVTAGGGAGAGGGAIAGGTGGFVAAPTIGGIQTIVVPATTGGVGGAIGAGTGILAGTQVVGGGSSGTGATSGTGGATGTGTQPLPPDIPTITVTGTAPAAGTGTAAGVVAGGAAGAGTAPATTTSPVDPIDEILIQAGKAKDVSLLGPGSLASTSLIKGTPDIPVDIYGNPIETVTVTGTAPVDGPIVDPAVVGAGTAATTAVSAPTSTVVEPPIEEFVIETGNPDMPYITVPAGSVAEKILQQTKTGDTGRTDSLTDKAKGILTDYAQSQALSAALAALSGGAAGAGVGGAAGPKYQGTGGLGYLPEGQERRYIDAPEDYMHGFMPEFSFFENLNPPALIDTGTPGPTPPDDRDFPNPDEPIQRAVGGILPRRKVYSERGYLDLLQGYQEGGMVEEKEDIYEDLPGPVTDGNKRLVDLTKQVILGQISDRADEIIQKFIDMFGLEAFQDMREDLLEEAMPNSVKEGMVPGHTGGMDDMVDGVIGNQERVAVSPGEYIIPADVVSALGDGNSKKGEKELDSLLDRVRKSKYGSTKQPPPINLGKVMPV